MAELGEYEVASTLVERALTIHRRLGDRQREAASLGNLGIICRDRGDLGHAWQNIVQSLEMQNQVGDRRNAAVALGSLGQVYVDIGHFDHATACLTASILISLDIDNPQNVTIAAGALGEAYLLQGRTSRLRLSSFERLRWPACSRCRPGSASSLTCSPRCASRPGDWRKPSL